MEEQAIIEELLAMLEQNDIAVRTEPLGGRGGGLCKLKDKTLWGSAFNLPPPYEKRDDYQLISFFLLVCSVLILAISRLYFFLFPGSDFFARPYVFVNCSIISSIVSFSFSSVNFL